MSTVRAKFECIGIQEQPEAEGKTITLVPVIDGSEENKSFSKYTPAGNLSLTISNETPAANFFEAGKEYYLDFSLAE